MAEIQANPNFHTVGGKSVFRSKDPRFLEYRENWIDRPKNFFAGNFPLHLDIEASRSCNLRCPFCSTNYEPVAGRGFMSSGTFKKIIDEGAGEGLCAIKLNSGVRGEPLLNNDLPEMISYAKEKGIMDVYFNTNAALLTTEIGKKLIDSGLDRLSISFEGITPEVYETYRVGAKFSAVLENIENFIKLRGENRNPLVRIQTVALPALASVLADYRDFWAKRVDEVAFIDYKDYSRHDNLIGDWACPTLWQRMLIKWDGTISICQEKPDFYNLGNVNNGDSIKNVWNGKVMEELRAFHRKGQSHLAGMCSGCPFRTAEILKLKSKNI